MRILTFLVSVAATLFANTAHAQSLGPFADPAAIVQARGGAPHAIMEVRYAAALSGRPDAPSSFDLILDVAPDWVLVRNGDQLFLYDFRLDRLFVLNEANHSYVSYSSVAPIAFQVMERQNRAMLAQVLRRAGGGAAANLADDCDAESELNIAFPTGGGRTSVRTNGGTTELRCNNRVMGSFSAGHVAPPASFWPALARAITMHPALYDAIHASRQIPATIVTNYRTGGAQQPVQFEYRLSSAAAADIPYPLTDMTNANAMAMDTVLGPGVGAVANDAIAGRAGSGPPTFASWGAHLAQVRASDGPAAEAMLVGVSYNLFPTATALCATEPQNRICGAMSELRTTINSDPAVHAMYAIAAAEQQNRIADVIPAMTSARTSPLAQHPVLGESYALALLKFNDAQLAQAHDAGLPTDPKPLMAAALRAYPYNSAYWTDVAAWRAANYEWMEAMLFYDVANALPYPEAQQNRTVQSANQFFDRLHSDFPRFWLMH